MTTSEVRKREDQLLADFMDGRQVADMANVLDVDEWVVEAAIRNAIRRRERKLHLQGVASAEVRLCQVRTDLRRTKGGETWLRN